MADFLKLLYILLALNAISCVAASLDDNVFSGRLSLSGNNGMGDVEFEYSLDKCIERGYCLDSITTSKDIWDQFGTLTPSFLIETISALNTTFGVYYSDENFSIYFVDVPYELLLRRNRYIAMVIIYSIVSIGLYLVHHFKQRLALEYQFKLSKLSKLMLNYLAFKTAFKFIYFPMFAYLSDRGTVSLLRLYYLLCEDYIQGPVSFALAVLFAMGYGTRRFKIDASMAWKTALLTACDVLLTLPGLLRALDEYGDILDSFRFELPLTILYYGLISICIYIGYNTYKIDRDQRYMDSAKAIIIGVLLNAFVFVPQTLMDIRYFLITRVVRSSFQTFDTMAIPDVFELGVIIYLIYVWRDIRDEELGYIQLENIEI